MGEYKASKISSLRISGFRSGPKLSIFLLNRFAVLEEARQSFLQGHSPTTTQVVNNENVWGGVDLSRIFRADIMGIPESNFF